MRDPVQELYDSRSYPAMSHPLSDPAVSAVAARMAGLPTLDPANAEILEIGCGSGHNLIPLAMRWPGSRFLGIDGSAGAVRMARELAEIAGVKNLEFRAVDLLKFDPGGGGFDFIIAHGFFSWVPDEVKSALFGFCRRHLTAGGIATISFNLECGWLSRFPVIEKVRAIQHMGAEDEMAALAVLRTVTESASPELAMIDDMLQKGSAILPFDDFAPVNDPWSLEHFVESAGNAGLRWLGESDPGQNFPQDLAEEVMLDLRDRSASELELQSAADAIVGRTFRSVVMCRDDAPIASGTLPECMLEFSFRFGKQGTTEKSKRLIESIISLAPASVPLERVLGSDDLRQMAGLAAEATERGWLRARVETVEFDSEPPLVPRLDPFRLECARRELPLVDRWHQPCLFPAKHFAVLAAMNGKQDRAELAGFSSRHCPELAFDPWLRHLAGRGMFV